MNNIQILLVVVVVALLVLLIVVGIQVFLVIMDLRKAVRRFNNILEDAIVGGGLIKPDKLSGILEVFKKR